MPVFRLMSGTQERVIIYFPKCEDCGTSMYCLKESHTFATLLDGVVEVYIIKPKEVDPNCMYKHISKKISPDLCFWLALPTKLY